MCSVIMNIYPPKLGIFKPGGKISVQNYKKYLI